jgi:hypothetical protein
VFCENKNQTQEVSKTSPHCEFKKSCLSASGASQDLNPVYKSFPLMTTRNEEKIQKRDTKNFAE